MTRFTLVILALVSSAAVADGSISGGGMPGPVEMPKENFKYVCKIEYAQQINRKDGESCYQSFVATAETAKPLTDAGLGSLPTINVSDLQFKKGHGHGNCGGDKPLSVQNTFVSLSVYRNKNKES